MHSPVYILSSIIFAVDLLSWQEKIEGEIAGVDTEHEVEVRMEELPFDKKHIPYRDGVLTIGCCGKLIYRVSEMILNYS